MGRDCMLWYVVVACYRQASNRGSGFAEVFRLTLSHSRTDPLFFGKHDINNVKNSIDTTLVVRFESILRELVGMA